MAIWHILACDACDGSVSAGSSPSPTGRGTRLAGWRGTIRRVRLGYVVSPGRYGGPPRRTLRSMDICGACLRAGEAVGAQAIEARQAQAYGREWEPLGIPKPTLGRRKAR